MLNAEERRKTRTCLEFLAGLCRSSAAVVKTFFPKRPGLSQAMSATGDGIQEIGKII